MDYYKDRDWRKQLAHTRRRKSRKPFVLILIVIVLLAGGAFWWLYSRPTHAPSAPTGRQQAAASDILKGMSLRDKVASLFMFHTPSVKPGVLTAYYQRYKPSGLIFMGDNIPDTPAALRTETAALAGASTLPPLIAIDEEGDSVKRLDSDTYPGALTLPDLPPEATKTAYAQRSQLLHDLGFNLNFGIVADVSDDPEAYIFPRVLGTTPQAAADRVTQAVLGSKHLTLSTLKHFPGHGETVDNSHTTIPSTDATIEEWQATDKPPFATGINAGADLVMLGHLRYTAVDSAPASLSEKWHAILRDNLGFKGVAVTDDMVMLLDSGEAQFADPVANTVAAIKAGNDLILYVLNHENASSRINPDKLIDGVVAAVHSGQLSESVVDTHARAVLELRQKLAQDRQ